MNGRNLDAALPPGVRVCREEGHKWPASASIYLFRDDRGGALFDVGCGREESYRNLLTFLRGEGLELADIHTVILSHAHPDHMGAMRFIEQEASPEVVISVVDRPLADDPRQLNRTFDMGMARHYFGEGVIESMGLGSFDIVDYFEGMCPMSGASVHRTVEDGDLLELGGRHYRVVLTPGHAPGHVALWGEDDGVLLSSDLVGEITAWYSPSSGGAAGFLASLERVEGLGPRTILPAHGEPIAEPAAAIQRTRRRVLAVEERIERMLAREGQLRVSEICERMFPHPLIRFFPGIQIVVSHLDRMSADGRVELEGEGAGQTARLLR